MEAVKENLTIQPYSEEKTEDLISILMDAYQEHPEYGEATRKQAKRYINWLKKHSTLFEVAYIDGEPAGFIAADANWKDITGKRVGEIHELSIKKKFWGKGLGKFLLDRAIKHFKKRGLTTAGLWVGEKNDRAIQFYKKNGFKETGLNYYGWVRMERNL
ncbi:GNAT family N-acetyltransferase [Persephonella sp.]